MIFHETSVSGAFVVEAGELRDERGFFARLWCVKEFADRGLDTGHVQSNLSYNARRGTLRGMHFQAAPHEETKLVRCVAGAVFDVVLDLRAESQTFGRWHGVELTAKNRLALYVPRGCAHGYQTLTEDAEVLYQVSAFYSPEHERGVRWDDPRFSIEWPHVAERTISSKDAQWPWWEDR